MSIPITIIMTFQFCYEEIVSNIKYINIILSPYKPIENQKWFDIKDKRTGLSYIC